LPWQQIFFTIWRIEQQWWRRKMKKINTVSSDLAVDNEHHAFSPSESAERGHVSALDKWLAQRSLALLGNPAINLVLWDNKEIAGSQAKPVARLLVRDRKSLYKMLSSPNLHFGDLYSTWRVEVEGDLVEFLEALNRSIRDSTEIRWLKKHLAWVWKRPRINTLSGSKENIHHHYDISNEFYEMWLDKEMQYTCAYDPIISHTNKSLMHVIGPMPKISPIASSMSKMTIAIYLVSMTSSYRLACWNT
jgi:cyclopropane-fatty-acyl-phospholipid synthase